MKDQHRGKYERGEVMNALAQTRITPTNCEYVLQYLVEGVRFKDMDVARQQAHARVVKVLKILNKSVDNK